MAFDREDAGPLVALLLCLVWGYQMRHEVTILSFGVNGDLEAL